jgi:Fibronectin type III domain
MTTPAGAVASDAQAAQRQAGTAKTRPAGQTFWTRKYGPLPGWGWSLLAAGGGLAYFWWRKREASKTTAGATTAGTTSGTTASAISALQQEIDQLQYGYGTSGTVSGTTAGTTAKTTTKTTGTTTTKTTGTTTTKTKPGAPTGLAVNKITTTGATLHWDGPGPGTFVYNWTLYHASKIVKSGHVAHGDVGVGGLTPGTSYDFGVSATNSAGTGPASSRLTFKTKAK